MYVHSNNNHLRYRVSLTMFCMDGRNDQSSLLRFYTLYSNNRPIPETSWLFVPDASLKFLPNLVLPLLEHFWTPSTKMIMIFIFSDSFKNLCTNPCWNNIWTSLHFSFVLVPLETPIKTILCDFFYIWRIGYQNRVKRGAWSSFREN